MEWFYDKNGYAVCFQHGKNLISKDGKLLCWIVGKYIYNLKSGKHIGWFEDGKVYDIENGILCFLKDATGLPYRPGFHGTPGTPGIPGIPGFPGLSGIYARPCRFGFSNFDVLEYFNN